MTPQCVVPYNIVAKLKRYKNVKYVAQVTARPLVNDASNPAYTQIGNDGKSEMIVLLMEDDGQAQDHDIVVDNPQIDLPINVTVEPKFTELPSAMYPYFETPAELFNVTLENRGSETIPVCMLMQYYKGNWGVTAAPDKQHTTEFLELAPGAKVTLSEDEFNRLAGGYDFDRDVIAFKAKTGFAPAELDLGGGYGVRYKESDPFIDIAANIRQVADHFRTYAAQLGIDLPAIRMEPGRSIVADAGMTLYTVGTIKKIPGYKNYVSVDGGMTDNPRYALYGSH